MAGRLLFVCLAVLAVASVIACCDEEGRGLIRQGTLHHRPSYRPSGKPSGRPSGRPSWRPSGGPSARPCPDCAGAEVEGLAGYSEGAAAGVVGSNPASINGDINGEANPQEDENASRGPENKDEGAQNEGKDTAEEKRDGERSETNPAGKKIGDKGSAAMVGQSVSMSAAVLAVVAMMI